MSLEPSLDPSLEPSLNHVKHGRWKLKLSRSKLSTKHQKHYEKNKMHVLNLLKNAGIDNMSAGHRQFSDYLMNNNDIVLQQYLIMCAGYFNPKEAQDRLSAMIREMNFCKEGYTYREVFQMDQDWIPFFYENAYPSGQRRHLDDKRMGVDKSKVDRIMKVKTGPPVVSLDDAIVAVCLMSIEEQSFIS
jgi:hypothetical protein